MRTRRDPEDNARLLERAIIEAPPTNPPPGVPGIRAGQPGLNQERFGSGFEYDKTPFGTATEESVAGLNEPGLSHFEKLLKAILSERKRPPLFTWSFSFVAGGAGSALLVPAQPGVAIYVEGIWGKCGNVNAAFGQGTSSSDFEFFQGALAVASDLTFLNGVSFGFVNSFPDWVFRCDYGKGFMVHLAGAATIDGYVQFSARNIEE